MANLPGSHLTQAEEFVDACWSLYLPEAHDVHLANPDCDWYRPGGQVLQLCCPFESVYVPGAQGELSVIPFFPHEEPGGQSIQLVAPSVDTYLPCAHSAQDPDRVDLTVF